MGDLDGLFVNDSAGRVAACTGGGTLDADSLVGLAGSLLDAG